MSRRVSPFLLALCLAPASAGAVAALQPSAPEPAILARRLGASGTVVVEVLLDTTGVVRATNVVVSQPLLDDIAAESARRMTFEPSLKDGQAVPSTKLVSIEFPAPAADPIGAAEVERRCPETAFRLDLPPRPDSAGWITAAWQARGLKSQELVLVLLHPDGLEVDTTGSGPPVRVVDDPATPGWPTWRRTGTALRQKPDGTGGSISIRVPERTWWERGRVAFVALFHDAFEDRFIARQVVFEIARDPMGVLLVRDPRVPVCTATTGHAFRKRG